jgi:DNA-directed RNA polymerase specialized sigma24 family protein
MQASASPGAPAAAVVDRVPADAVHRAVRALPADLRIVLYLTDVEGLSHREAARVMGTSVSVLTARLHRARSWLGACLAPRILNASA